MIHNGIHSDCVQCAIERQTTAIIKAIEDSRPKKKSIFDSMVSAVKMFFGRYRYEYTKWRDPWEYGYLESDILRRYRRHKRKGNVQFILWRAGQQGHSEDYWHNADESYWPSFIALK